MAKAFRYEDNIDTDAIIPARCLTTADPVELAVHCMEDLDADFSSQVRSGDILVAGTNFGCGSSREHAPIALKGSGLACVIAKSYARIFYRNSFNIGFPILECPAAVDGIKMGDDITVDLNNGTIVNETTGQRWTTSPIPPFMTEIIEANGLVNFLKEKGSKFRANSTKPTTSTTSTTSIESGAR